MGSDTEGQQKERRINMVTLRIVIEQPCESVADAIQTALDFESRGSEPLEILHGERVIVDGRSLRRQMSDLCSGN